MSLVDDDARAELPSMSWDSVVPGTGSAPATPAPPAPPSPAPAEPPPAVTGQLTAPAVDPPTEAPAFSISLSPTDTPAAAPAPVAPSQPSAAPLKPSVSIPPLGTAATELATPVVEPDPEPIELSMPSITATPAAPAPVAAAASAPAIDPVATPAVDVAPAPAPAPAPAVAATAEAAPTPVPVPVADVPPAPVAAEVAPAPVAAPEPVQVVPEPAPVAAPEPAPVPAPEPASVAAPVEPAPTPEPAPVATPEPAPVAAPVQVAPEPVAAPPVEPTTQQQHASLPSHAEQAVPQPAQASASPLAVDTRSRPRRSKRVKKDRSGGIARFAFVFLLVAAVAAAGVIFGRPYLFPSDWDAEALPFAESVEAVRGVEYVEPVTISPMSTQAHSALVATELLGDPASQLPMWRALGLVGPDGTDPADLEQLLDGVSPVVYSTADGQVYTDETYVLGDRDARIMRAMAVAAIDQDVTFSTVSSDFGLDDRALVEAHVLQQSAAIQLASDEPFTVADPNVAPFAFLPPVLDYRLTAPVVFNDLLPETSDVEANPLADLVNGGPGPLHTEPMVLLTRDSQVSGDQPVTETAAMDRSFWFMVFATHLDSVTAYEMSNSIEQSGLQLVAGADGTCAVASFSSGNATANAELTGRLARWAETTAVELGATVTSLPDSSVQLRSCDPVGSYTFSGRFGVSRQLLGWRATELALITSVTELGGTDDTVAAALPLLAQSEAVLAVTELPAGTPADEVAAAAEAAAVDIANAVMALDAAAESGES